LFAEGWFRTGSACAKPITFHFLDGVLKIAIGIDIRHIFNRHLDHAVHDAAERTNADRSSHCAQVSTPHRVLRFVDVERHLVFQMSIHVWTRR